MCDGNGRLVVAVASLTAAGAARAAAQEGAPAAETAPAQPELPVAPVETLPLPGGEAPGSAPESAWIPDLSAPAHDLSPWGMFLAADIVVQAVMVGLVAASVVTWTVWLAKSLELSAAKTRLRRMTMHIAGARTLDEASDETGTRRSIIRGLIDAAQTELRLSSDIDGQGRVEDRVRSRLERIEIAAGRDINRGTGVLATIGSTAPFVGLFGTVWGIMNAFIGISEAQTTNLAVVAPGIAEALLATGLGLAAAIPAVIIYNQFARSIAGYKAMVGDASSEIMRLVSRDLDRQPIPRTFKKAAE
jgi:biopolymer transport protein ExbB